LLRVSSRFIIIEDNCIYAFFRRKKTENNTINEYYTIPGGGVEENETIEEAVFREASEEFGIKVNILKYFGNSTNDLGIAHFFLCEIKEGTPILGGEELDKHCEDNFYEIVKLPIKDLNNYNLIYREAISKFLYNR